LNSEAELFLLDECRLVSRRTTKTNNSMTTKGRKRTPKGSERLSDVSSDDDVVGKNLIHSFFCGETKRSQEVMMIMMVHAGNLLSEGAQAH
jgi:hypothetical protein